MSKLLVNCVMCPDGTIIQSTNRHDFRKHTTVDTWKSRSLKMDDREAVPDQVRETVVDGGTEYLRRMGTYTEMSVYDDDPFEVIRRFLCRGGRGIGGDQPLTYVPLFRMDEDWLQYCIDYNNERGIAGHNEWYQKELDYRKNNKQ